MSCALCQAPKGVRECENCERTVCKKCVRFLEKDNFKFHPKPAKVMKMQVFCFDCYEDKIAPELHEYERVLALAKEVIYLTKNYRGPVPVVRKAKEPAIVKRHVDRKEAILHLGFLAAHAGFNGIIQASETARQVRNYGYETSDWTAEGLPVWIDLKKFDRLNYGQN